MTSMMARMGTTRSKSAFISSLADMMSEFNHCHQFGIYEISPSEFNVRISNDGKVREVLDGSVRQII